MCLQGAPAIPWLMLQHPPGHARPCCAGLVGIMCQAAGQRSHCHVYHGTVVCLVWGCLSLLDAAMPSCFASQL